MTVFSVFVYNRVRMAQWIRRLPTEQEILGSSPSTDFFRREGVYAENFLFHSDALGRVFGRFSVRKTWGYASLLRVFKYLAVE